MNSKNHLQNLFRGWLPQEPTLAFRGTQDKKQPFNWALLPVLAPGALMIIAAVLSADSGLSLVSTFPGLFPRQPETMFNTIVYIGTANVVAAVLGFISGVLLLVGKRVKVSIACLFTVLALGLATPIFPVLDGQPWQVGSIVSMVVSPIIAPMIVPPAIALTIVGINRQKPKANSEGRITTQNKQLPAIEPLTVGAGAAGCAFLFSTITGAILWPIYYMQQTNIVTNGASPLSALMLVAGVTLLLTSFSMRAVQKHRFINGSSSKEALFNRNLFVSASIANATMLGLFFGVNLLIQPPLILSLRTNFLQWSIFLPAVLAVNALVFWNYRRRLLASH